MMRSFTKKIRLEVLMLCTILCMTACEGRAEQTSGQKVNQESVQVAESEENAATEENKELEEKDKEWMPEKRVYKLFTGESVSLASDNGEDIVYRSHSKKTATVSKNGMVHGIQAGKTKISVSKGEQTYSVKVKVRKRGMVYPKFSMMTGEILDLQFSNGTMVSNWVCDQKKVASVTKKGTITAKKVGKTTIHGTDGERTYTCELTVKKKVSPIIYLTFDDGPNRYTTPKVLDILKKNHVKATFFELKPAQADFDLTRRVVKEGHSLAMHGYQHKYDMIYRSVKIYRENLDKLRSLLFQETGVWCTNSRFPGGSSNTVSRYNPGVMTRITNKIHQWGYRYYDWNVSSGDSDGIKTSDALFQNVVAQLSKSHDNVVLMHDYANNNVMLGALDRIIKYGKKEGYTFLPITASTAEVHHRVNN